MLAFAGPYNVFPVHTSPFSSSYKTCFMDCFSELIPAVRSTPTHRELVRPTAKTISMNKKKSEFVLLDFIELVPIRIGCLSPNDFHSASFFIWNFFII